MVEDKRFHTAPRVVDPKYSRVVPRGVNDPRDVDLTPDGSMPEAVARKATDLPRVRPGGMPTMDAPTPTPYAAEEKRKAKERRNEEARRRAKVEDRS